MSSYAVKCKCLCSRL